VCDKIEYESKGLCSYEVARNHIFELADELDKRVVRFDFRPSTIGTVTANLNLKESVIEGSISVAGAAIITFITRN
jgi:hypothetical protein